MDRTVELILGENTFKYPILKGSFGDQAIDIRNMRQETGLITLDPSYANTGSCASRITYIDGEKGVLLYRGYPIGQLAGTSSFLEVAYLLLFGELPTEKQMDSFGQTVNDASLIHEDMSHFFDAFPRTAHPMGVLSTMVASLSTFYPAPEDMDEEQKHRILASIISKVRTLAAFSYKKSIGEPIVYPSWKQRFVEKFLNMMFDSPVRDYQPDQDTIAALEIFLILHADHGQNCSTSTVRMAGSSMANLYAVVSAGIAALWGKRHGGANQEVICLLEDMKASKTTPAQIIERAKTRNARLPGFGHRIYRKYDPRAAILKQYCDRMLKNRVLSDECFRLAQEIESLVLSDDYFKERNLYPNVDFYSGILLRAIGIPINMFTVLFVMGRVAGWLANWREMNGDPESRIARPRQVYCGHITRDYVPIERRTRN